MVGTQIERLLIIIGRNEAASVSQSQLDNFINNQYLLINY